MLFTTPLFLFAFLPTVLFLYYVVPSSNLSLKNNFIFLASFFFFSWGEPLFVLFLLTGTYLDYRLSILISPSSKLSIGTRKLILGFGIAINVLILIFFKYVDFLVDGLINPLFPLTGITLNSPHIALVLGISFITFHRVSYLVDSFIGRAVPPRGFLDCALYIFFFPQLIAGPIIRYHDIGLQIQEREHKIGGFLTGFNRFSIGLVKKLLIADSIGEIADAVFNLPVNSLPTSYAWGGMIAYTMQIYFDFSGYSDMAIGLGRMFGFRFPENFNQPYTSTSISEFWQRWHISLSKWMLQYLYIPLGGNKVSTPRTYLNLWIVFLISGFWHGASWNFIAWGAYYGFFLSSDRFLSSRKVKKVNPPTFIKWLLTFLIVMIGWILFRSPTLEFAGSYIFRLVGIGELITSDVPAWGMIFSNKGIVAIIIAGFFAFIRINFSSTSKLPLSITAAWSEKMLIHGNYQVAIQFLITIIFTLLAAAALASSKYAPFLYFRF
jgi:alginate O-acetyltransferase complex protein AlgI